MTRLLLFGLGEQLLAVPASLGREAFVPQGLSRLPGAGALLGLTSVRGRAAPLIDLAALLDLPAPGAGLALLVEFAGERLAFGVDQVQGFVTQDALPQPGPDLTSPLPGQATRLLHLDVLAARLRAQFA